MGKQSLICASMNHDATSAIQLSERKKKHFAVLFNAIHVCRQSATENINGKLKVKVLFGERKVSISFEEGNRNRSLNRLLHFFFAGTISQFSFSRSEF